MILLFTVGIPMGTWKITDLSSTEKEDLCTRQQSFCTVSLSRKQFIVPFSILISTLIVRTNVEDKIWSLKSKRIIRYNMAMIF